MLWMNILGIIMAALTAGFWCWEAAPGVLAIKSIPSEGFGDKLIYLFRVIGTVPKFVPLAIDLSATIWLTSMFSMGGVWGIGLTISNVISLFIVIMSMSKGTSNKYAIA